MSTAKLVITGLLVVAAVMLLLSRRDARESSAVTSGSEGMTLMGYVRGIEGRSPEGRRRFITDELTNFGVPFSVAAFDTVITDRRGQRDTLHGTNIVVTMGTGGSRIVVGAHSDAVPGAPGANDNGGGVAVVLELISSLKEFTFRHTVDFCFFDHEEDGLIGSAVYVRTRDRSEPFLAMINLDVEGTGDQIYVGPVGGGDDDIVMKYIRAARDKTGYPYHEDHHYPDSDYESFARAKLENISISVVPKGDAEKLARFATPGFRGFKTPEEIPQVLKVMHTPHDSSTYVSPQALNMSYLFTRATLLGLDGGEQ